MNYKNDFTNCDNILADFVCSVCWDGANGEDNWFLEYPRVDTREEAYEQILAGKRATLVTLYGAHKMWIKNEVVKVTEDMVEGDYIYLPLKHQLAFEANTDLMSANKNFHYYRTDTLSSLDTAEYYVDFIRNTFVVSKNEINDEDNPPSYALNYEASTSDSTRWYVEFDYSNSTKNYFGYKFSKEIDEDGHVINKKRPPVETRCYWHTLDVDTYPMESWMPIEYIITWDYMSLNFVMCEEPVHSESIVHGWGYVGALEEIKDAENTDFFTNFGAAGNNSFNDKNPYASNILDPPYLLMFETKSGRPYAYYSVGMYSEYEFAQKAKVNGASAFTDKFSSSKLIASEQGENERGYLRNMVATSRIGKSHKDPFVKYKDNNEKERQYIYVDLLHDTKNIFANSNNVMRSIALLCDLYAKNPRGNITFSMIDVDTEEKLYPDEIHNNVTYAQKRVDREINVGEDKDYMLIGPDFMKYIIFYDGENKKYVFPYSQRFGTFTFNFLSSDETPIVILAPVVFTKKTEVIYTNPNDYIQYNQYDRYKLKGKNTITLTATKPNDDQSYDYIYDLIVSRLSAYFRDELDNSIKVLPDEIYDGLSHYTFTAPQTVGPDVDGFNEYKLTSLDDTVTLVAAEGVAEQNITFLYALVTGTFTFNYLNENLVVIAPQEIITGRNHIVKTAPTIIHDLAYQADDEYYELNEDEEQTVTLIAEIGVDNQTHTFDYTRILGDLSFTFIDNENTAVFPREDYDDVPSAIVTAPAFKSFNSNINFSLKTGEENPVRLIVTPDNRTQLHQFNYQRNVFPAVMNINIDTQCIYQDGMRFVIYETTGGGDVIRLVLDQLNNADSGSYSRTLDNLSFNVSFSHYIDPNTSGRKLKWDCTISENGYSNPVNKTYKIGGINMLTNDHICDYGYINYMGLKDDGSGMEIKLNRKLTHVRSFADWRPSPTGSPFVGQIVNTGSNPKEYSNVYHLTTIDLSKYLVEEVYSIDMVNTVSP